MLRRTTLIATLMQVSESLNAGGVKGLNLGLGILALQ